MTGLGLVYLLLATRRRPFRFALFCAWGAGLSLAAGGWALRETFVLEWSGSPGVAVVWAVGLAVGFAAVGLVAAAGLAALLQAAVRWRLR